MCITTACINNLKPYNVLYKLIKQLPLNDLSNMNNASRNNLQEQSQPPPLLCQLAFSTDDTKDTWELSSQVLATSLLLCQETCLNCPQSVLAHCSIPNVPATPLSLPTCASLSTHFLSLHIYPPLQDSPIWRSALFPHATFFVRERRWVSTESFHIGAVVCSKLSRQQIKESERRTPRAQGPEREELHVISRYLSYIYIQV